MPTPENNEQSNAAAAPPTEGANEIKNMKAEVNRKLSSYEQKLAEVAQGQAQLLEQLSKMATPAKPTEPTKTLEDAWYDSPAQAANMIKQDMRREFNDEMNIRNEQTNVISKLVADFPELSDPAHDLTKRAVEIYSRLSPQEKSSPTSYKTAVMEAALETGVKPKSKRPADDYDNEDVNISSSSYSDHGARRGKKGKKENLDPRTVEFANLISSRLDNPEILNIDDPKVVERLKDHNSRSWTKYK